MFQIVTNLITARALFSPVLLPQNQIRIGPDEPFQRYRRRLTAVILDLVQPEVGPFDPPSPKPLSRTKHEVDQMTRCRDMAVRNFPKCEVGRSSVLNIYIVLMYSSTLRQERRARGVKMCTPLKPMNYGVVTKSLGECKDSQRILIDPIGILHTVHCEA